MALGCILHDNSQVRLIIKHFLKPERVAKLLDAHGVTIVLQAAFASRLKCHANAMQMPHIYHANAVLYACV